MYKKALDCANQWGVTEYLPYGFGLILKKWKKQLYLSSHYIFCKVFVCVCVCVHAVYVCVHAHTHACMDAQTLKSVYMGLKYLIPHRRVVRKKQ